MAASVAQDKKKIAVIGGVLEGAVSEFSSTQGALKQVAVGMNVDDRRHVLIKDRFEDALTEIAATQASLQQLAASVA